MNAKQFSKVKVGDIIYWNGPGEAECLVVEVQDENILIIKRNLYLDILELTDPDNLVDFSRKPHEHIVYYHFFADGMIRDLQARMLLTIRDCSNLISLIVKATDNDD